jgi:hypothetical protein
MSSNDDTQILKGIDALINFENVRGDIDLRDVEKQLVGSKSSIVDPVDRFDDELKNAAKLIGLNFEELGMEDDDDDTNDTESLYQSNDNPYHDNIQSDSPNPLMYSRADDVSVPITSYGTSLQTQTDEQLRRQQINAVMSDTSPSFSIEAESEEEQKALMLGDIDTLLQSLTEDNIDVSRIARVDQKSSYADIESVLRILRRKQDYQRFSTVAEEFILFGAYALEEIFDGKRRWAGFSPDLTGYHNTAQTKLRRCRGDTGILVSSVMQGLNFGPGMRLLFELLPSMVLHSKMRKQQHGQSDLYDDDSMAMANNNIRDATE